MGRHDEARALEAAAVVAFEQQQNRRMIAGARIYLATAHLGAGDAAGALAEARRALDEPSAPRSFHALALGIAAGAHLAEGRPAEALAASREAVEILQSAASIEEGDVGVLLVHARALAAIEDQEGARAAIGAARDLVLRCAARISDEALRRSFVENVPENALTLSLAKAWLGG